MICKNHSKIDQVWALIKKYAYVESFKKVKTCTFSQVLFFVRETIPGMIFDFFYLQICINQIYADVWVWEVFLANPFISEDGNICSNICTTFQKLIPPPIIQSFFSFNPVKYQKSNYSSQLFDIYLFKDI